MIKKHNTTVLLLILAVFMFSIILEASATTLLEKTSSNEVSSEAIHNNAAYNAMNKLNKLGIIDSYPDGDFAPDKTISRAELAKIVVNMAGEQSMIEEMSSKSSSFNDVNPEDWFNGFINVAAASGYLKGDPSGNFRPNDQVKQSEVTTVFLRLLGYNDNLPGKWPANYIGKSAQLGILDDITFLSEKAASRGEVALMASETLEQYVVQYEDSSNSFKNALKVEAEIIENGDSQKEVPYTLLQDKFKENMVNHPE